MINYQLLITGRVQGVGFRWATAQLAHQLGLVGTVQNLADGRVKIVVQGDPVPVQTFLARVQAGPTPGARVTAVRVQQAAPVKLTTFTILPS